MYFSDSHLRDDTQTMNKLIMFVLTFIEKNFFIGLFLFPRETVATLSFQIPRYQTALQSVSRSPVLNSLEYLIQEKLKLPV